ncbi:MAG TPA: asparaginase [Longimicrobiales bacterium]|nr:asparaginase [Longimicrobiales bacterium]
MSTTMVEVLRGDVVESRHRVHVAVTDADGALRVRSGDPSVMAFARSAVKPFQALPLVEDGGVDAYGFTAGELALMCASHSGERAHTAAARSMLAKVGAAEDMLACGPHEPFHEASARALREAGTAPTRVHNNCSGKHAGMLALARLHGWPLEGYHEASHPVQRRMLVEIVRWTGAAESDVGLAVDGCGVTTFALPLQSLATAFARLARASLDDGAAARVVDAMVSHPEMVGGTGRLCTDVMRVTHGRVFLKVGAEGVYCAALRAEALGVALKVEDGNVRALYPALVAVLRGLGWIDDEELGALGEFARPVIRNTRDEVVGALRVRMALEPVHG